MTICYSFASRSRPDRFFETLDNITQMSAQQNHFVVAKLDTDDPTMNSDAIKARIDSYPGVLVRWGTSRSKIHAINRDLEDLPHWDVMVCLSDDMRFCTHGFDDLIRQYMPEDLDGFIHLQDDYAKDRVSTVSILGRKYYERDNAIYNDAYFSMWCDDEETEKANIRGKYILVPGTHIEHLHYTNNAKAKKDELYWRNDTYNADKAIFEQRKAMNFGL
jgi:adenine deaminase